MLFEELAVAGTPGCTGPDLFPGGGALAWPGTGADPTVFAGLVSFSDSESESELELEEPVESESDPELELAPLFMPDLSEVAELLSWLGPLALVFAPPAAAPRRLFLPGSP